MWLRRINKFSFQGRICVEGSLTLHCASMQMDKRDVEAEQSNMKGGESAGGGFANPGEHSLGGGYTGTLKDITGGQTGGFKDLTGGAASENLVDIAQTFNQVPMCNSLDRVLDTALQNCNSLFQHLQHAETLFSSYM